MKIFKKILIVLLWTFVALIIIWRAMFIFKFPVVPQYGVNFSQKQAESLNLDWRKVYLSALEEMQVKNFRLIAYWDLVEPEQGKFNFTDLDWQMDQARLHNAKVILAIGQRVPRWPECHYPTWVLDLSEQEKEQALLGYLEAVVSHYQTQPALEIWQVENEPFLEIFGECPPRNKPLLLKELALVKELDPSRPTMVTDSGEEATWFRTRHLADYLGTSVYRTTYPGQNQLVPAAYYQLKAWIIQKPMDKILVSEFQAEPWSRKALVDTPLEKQNRNFNLAKFTDDIEFSQKLGFSRVYWWGVEWWYWLRLQGDASIWNAAKELF